MPPAKLNPKQERFVAEYPIDLNATQAAIRAGYSPKTAHVQGCNLLKHPKVSLAIQERLKDRVEKTGVTADYVLTSIVEVIDRCRQAEPVKDHNGNPTGEWTFQAGPALKGLELLAKHLGMFIERSEQTVTVKHEERVETIQDILNRRRQERGLVIAGPVN